MGSLYEHSTAYRGGRDYRQTPEHRSNRDNQIQLSLNPCPRCKPGRGLSINRISLGETMSDERKKPDSPKEPKIGSGLAFGEGHVHVEFEPDPPPEPK